MKICLDLLMTQQQSAYDFKGSEGFRRVQDCYRKKGGAQEKKGLFLSRAIVFGGGEFLSCRLPLPPMGADGDCLLVLIRKFQTGWLIEINCLGEAETIINEV